MNESDHSPPTSVPRRPPILTVLCLLCLLEMVVILYEIPKHVLANASRGELSSLYDIFRTRA